VNCRKHTEQKYIEFADSIDEIFIFKSKYGEKQSKYHFFYKHFGIKSTTQEKMAVHQFLKDLKLILVAMATLPT